MIPTLFMRWKSWTGGRKAAEGGQDGYAEPAMAPRWPRDGHLAVSWNGHVGALSCCQPSVASGFLQPGSSSSPHGID